MPAQSTSYVVIYLCAGMGAGLPKYNTINLGDLSLFKEGEVVTIEALEEKRFFNLSGRETKLPLKVSSLCSTVLMLWHTYSF